ncbi:MAG: ABC transporter substrate-binding protein, partial [Phycisphaerales bacterium]
FGAGWRRPADLERSAERIVEGGAVRTQAVERAEVPPAVAQMLAARAVQASARTAGGHLPTIAAITYSRTPNFDDAYRGFLAEMEAIGLGDGVGARIELRDAQLDIGALGTIVAAVSAERPDVVVPFTTPALQAVMRKIKDRPVVFSLVASGIEAGAGRSAADHLPNVTGAQIEGDWTRMIEVLKDAMPGVRRVGTVFAPGEANSVFNKESWRQALAAAGIELVAVGADRPTELSEAADGLVTQGIDAVAQISDNASSMGFATIVRAADRAGLAVFSFTPGSMRAGATFAVARDFEDVGRVSARLVKRVLAGEAVAGIPFADPQRTVLHANPERLQRFGIRIPPEILQDATVVREGDPAP